MNTAAPSSASPPSRGSAFPLRRPASRAQAPHAVSAMPSMVCQAMSGNPLRLTSAAAATSAVRPTPQVCTGRRVTSTANAIVASVSSTMARTPEAKNSGPGSAKSSTCSTAEPSGRAEMMPACGTSPCRTRQACARMNPWSVGWNPNRPTRHSVASARAATHPACTAPRAATRPRPPRPAATGGSAGLATSTLALFPIVRLAHPARSGPRW